MAHEPPSPVEIEVPLDVDGLDSQAPGLGLISLELPAAIGRFIRQNGNDRREEAIVRKRADLLLAQHLGHAFLQVPDFDNGSGFVIDYTRQKQHRLPQSGLGGSLMKMLVRTAAVAALIAGLGALPVSAEDTIKVGVLVGYSGIGSLSGQQTDATIKLFQQKYGDAPGGKKIEFVRRDTDRPQSRGRQAAGAGGGHAREGAAS